MATESQKGFKKRYIVVPLAALALVNLLLGIAIMVSGSNSEMPGLPNPLAMVTQSQTSESAGPVALVKGVVDEQSSSSQTSSVVQSVQVSSESQASLVSSAVSLATSSIASSVSSQAFNRGICPSLVAKTYRIGTQSQEISDLQTCLRLSGHFNFPRITGYYGEITLEAHNRAAGRVAKTPTGSIVAHPQVANRILQQSLGTKIIYTRIDLQKSYYIENGSVIKETVVTTGRSGYETVTGTYSIYSKSRNVTLTSPFANITYNVPVKYWMPFYRGYGFHDRSSRTDFGSMNYPNSGSYGCVNTPDEPMAFLYNWAPVGTKVIVE